jgi:hypothetical protein
VTDFSQRFKGSDVAWLAVDASEHVAVFTTAGLGPIPESALESVEHAEALIRALPVRGGHTLIVSIPRPDDFVDFSARGFFSYDWQDLHRSIAQERGAYDLMSVPISPISLSALPQELRRLAEMTRLKVTFGDLEVRVLAAVV